MDLFPYYVGLDVHRKKRELLCHGCTGYGGMAGQGAGTPGGFDTVGAQSLPAPWCGGLEATICSHWIH